MSLAKQTAVDLIEVVDQNVQVRNATIIKDDDVEIAKTYHRSVITRGQSARVDAAADELKAAVNEFQAGA